MRARRGAAFAFAFAGLVAASCGVEHSAPMPVGADASVDILVAPSPAAASRIAEIRRRFPLLGPSVAVRFEAVTSGSHVRAVLPTEALRDVTRTARVALPLRADGEVELEDERSHLSVRFALDHMQNARVELAGGIALYAGAFDGSDVVHRVHAEGTEDYVVFETRPARQELSYTVDVSRVPGLRLVSNTLEFLDATGTPLLRVAPPYVVDAGNHRHEARLAVAGCAYDESPAGPWGRKVTKPGADRCSVRVTWAGDIAYPAMVDPAWSATGSMATPRFSHAATVLPSGSVLITGGRDGASTLASAELFDAAGNAGAGTFAATGSMAAMRTNHTANLLASGKVLIVGGQVFGSTYHATAELFDPAGNAGAGSFAATGSMITARAIHATTVLPSGKVLVAGGYNGVNNNLGDAELFDPAGNAGAGSFTATGSMAANRGGHTATLLPSGKVLIAGGQQDDDGYLLAAELFDSAGNAGAGTFVATGTMVSGRRDHTASVLPSGKILIAGGCNGGAACSTDLQKAELFDPAGNAGAGTFAATGSMAAFRVWHTASVLPSGKVLVAGGSFPALASAELFDSAGNAGIGSFAPAGSLVVARALHTASLLPSGKVLVTGGQNGARRAELYGGVLGDSCTTNGNCLLPGFCADGVCCNTACNTQGCDRCNLPGKEGTCSIAPIGTPGADPSCVQYACDGASAVCPTSCASDAVCATDYYCAPDATCQPRKAQASACNTQTDCKEPGCRACASGFCVDGFCCDTACSGTCQACAAMSKQSGRDDGTCGPTKGGIDLRNQCSPDGTPCGADGQCNGTGACALVTPAGASDSKVCDGAGSCLFPTASCDGDHTIVAPDGKTQDCAPYRCESKGACAKTCSSVADCVAPTICDSTMQCVSPPADAGGEGCSVVTARASDQRAHVAWLACAAGLALLRRRRRADRS